MTAPHETSTDVEDLAVERALGGAPDAVACLRVHVAETGGQVRPQQERMAVAVEEAITREQPLLVQAGTGTGKSLAYAFAAAVSGKRTVIATATNQLGEQLARKDMPMVAGLLSRTGATIPVALLKGRSNYVCRAKIRELHDLEAGAPTGDTLFDPATLTASRADDARALRELLEWADSTGTGDRSEGPAVSNRVWQQVSVGSSDCAGTACPFYDSCFTEVARRQAKAARIVLTNHSLIAQDIRLSREAMPDAHALAGTPGGATGLLGPAPVIIVDEAHAFAETVTRALSTTVDPGAAVKIVAKAEPYVSPRTAGEPSSSRSGDVDARSRHGLQAADALAALMQDLNARTPGTLTDIPAPLEDALTEAAHAVVNLARKVQQAATQATADGKPKRAAAATLIQEQLAGIAEDLLASRTDIPGTVRWIQDTGTGRHLCTAPVNVADPVQEWAALGQRTVIATSATLTVAGSFDSTARTLGLQDATCLDVGSPFDYPNQGMLYVPGPPFPAPLGKERLEHTEHVLTAVERLVAAAGGRALLLFTTTAGAIRAAEHLRSAFPAVNVLCHGEAPADTLVTEFRDDEQSVLCATMGLWHGVDVPGPACSLVVIDKIPFPPMDDALTAARRANADHEGRDGFTDVYVASAAIDLAQATGRLIRRHDDKGVVAILDPRLHTKPYGRVLLQSLPGFPRYTDLATVEAALRRLTGGLPPGKPGKSTKTSASKPKSTGAPRARTETGASATGTGRPTGGRTRKRRAPQRRPRPDAT